jgi:hypothetical protein
VNIISACSQSNSVLTDDGGPWVHLEPGTQIIEGYYIQSMAPGRGISYTEVFYLDAPFSNFIDISDNRAHLSGPFIHEKCYDQLVIFELELEVANYINAWHAPYIHGAELSNGENCLAVDGTVSGMRWSHKTGQ